MKSNRFRSKSFDRYQHHRSHGWLKAIFSRFKSLTRRHKRNKSEKSVHSQTELKSFLNLNDSAIQCSEYFIKTNTTRNSLLESYIFDISEKSLSKSDFLEIDKHRKQCYKPIKILNQIIHDVLSHFPEIENTLIDLVDNLINEFCLKFLKVQFSQIKKSLIIEESQLNLNINKLFPESSLVNNNDSSSLSAYTFRIKSENKTQTDYFVNRNNCMKNKKIRQLKEKTDSVRHHICRRYVVKKCRNSKEIMSNDETGKEGKSIGKDVRIINDSVIDDVSINQNLSIDKQHLSTSKDFENITNEFPCEFYNNHQLCTVTISPMCFLAINDKVNEGYNTNSKTLHSSCKEKSNFETHLSQFDADNVFFPNSMNPRMLSMAQGDSSDLYKGFRCDSLDRITKSELNKRTVNNTCENSSTLDLEIVFGLSEIPDGPVQLKTDLSTNENLSITTEEDSFQSHRKTFDSPIQVSVVTSVEICPEYKVSYFPTNLTNSNTFEQTMPTARMNMFCESLCDKFNSKINRNIYQCDTEMSFSTKQSKFPDQTILMSNAISNNSDTVCEVLSGKFTEDSKAGRPLKSHKNSVKFLEILSNDMLNKSKFKSSSLFSHTIASKLKIKNSNQFH